MESVQMVYELSDQLIQTITNCHSSTSDDTWAEELIMAGNDINCLHGTLQPLHCACMFRDLACVELLLKN